MEARVVRNNRLFNVGSITFAALFSWFFYSIVLDNGAPISVDDSPKVLNPQPVARNDNLRIRYHVTVERKCTGRGQRYFVDAGGIPQPTVPFKTNTGELSNGQVLALGEAFDFTVEATVPNGAAPGAATYQNQTTYYCNFWQKALRRGIPVDWPIIGFEIGDKVLPRVAPSTSVFKRTDRNDVATWLRQRVGWNLEGK